ncbi:MAG: hypothetical protein A3I05_09080 [Deltaproteobacteria bacterium RIFCSPLOWO2_02_FULL_44_10]|nr:MAG: hypothetical protein A3C46_08535 [Deltaproteobacteria bacterium RIFCSPHIGHO2_02_FULL_44_16]OGQ45255.1 MAG: hypothetical protein A3I05_09080 [Deltaproteobacteria bacterium RIFCSPLOWO2_02_FULL_44_10]
MNDPKIKKLYRQCYEQMRTIAILGDTQQLLGWDRETMMPKKGAANRAEQMAVMTALLHERATAPEIGETLQTLNAATNTLSSGERANVREWLRDYEKIVKIPKALATEISRTTSRAHDVWIEARQKKDFSLFAPWLSKIIKLSTERAEAIGYTGSRYNALLDGFEPYMTVDELDPILDDVRRHTLSFLEAICHSTIKAKTSFLHKRYPIPQQEAVSRMIMERIGLTSDGTRLDRAVHPFCSGAHPDDVRMTTRYSEINFPQSISTVMHEGGHAIYQQQLDIQHFGTPLADPISLGIHESQSRTWEHLVGSSWAFTSFLFPKLKKLFPQQLQYVKARDYYKAVNSVQPSFIRVDSDEVTYNLHIVLRYELERGLFEGKIKVKDLPALWNEKMKKYLGIIPHNDALGVLQDTHWSWGAFGYFPTYTLGNLYAAQFWTKIQKDLPDIEDQIRKGKFQPLREWLRKNIHTHGRRYSASELVKRVTGKPLSSQYFVDYIKKKYGEIYDISL